MTRQAGRGALVDGASLSEFERRWHEVQADFIEDPRRAVGEAGGLMADLMEHVAKNLRSRRGELDRQRGGESDTEAMRQEMYGYKGLMSRMLHGEPQPQQQIAPQVRPPQAPVSPEGATVAPQNRPQNRPKD
jgi:hypothetical protein